jgi:hypothetical protein
MNLRFASALIILSAAVRPADASEPNETFAEATILSPGVLSVSDSLEALRTPPDTLLGIKNSFDELIAVDDDSSPIGNGFASGFEGLPTASGSINFAVTGHGDDLFEGIHSESGNYQVFVDVYDFSNEPIDSFSEIRRLAPGVVHDFSYSDVDWTGGSYDVYIDNVIGFRDVDFFTFTGLTPGAQFSARTADPSQHGVDTMLGWFDESGALLELNNDYGSGVLSRVAGVVPAGGTLTFAVTGFGDDGFLGDHTEESNYDLLLEFVPDLPGDYNEDNVVDAADYTVWRDHLGDENSLPNDDTPGVGPDDYTRWKTHFGQSNTGAAAQGLQVPEPTGFLLLSVSLVSAAIRRGERAS